ncbi:albusnodin/ikarugamycin family macrolactam cyclase [Streptomyces sp. NPDC001493]
MVVPGRFGGHFLIQPTFWRSFVVIGGFSSTENHWPRPRGATLIAPLSSVWRLGHTPARVAVFGARRTWVLGLCGADDDQLRALATRPVPTDVTWRWSGSYAVVEETPEGVLLHTDPAASFPLYAVQWQRGWAWATSARMLAALAGADLDVQRLACTILAPSVPMLSASRTCFAGVQQLAPGSRIMLPRSGASLRRRTVWRPDPDFSQPAHQRLRQALEQGTALRVASDARLTSDLSGGLDSSPLTVLASLALPESLSLDAVTIHPHGVLDGADLRFARMVAAAPLSRIRHHLLPMGAEHRPYSDITSVPATDEPAPSTLTQARLRGQFRWMHDQLLSRTHLTGDGGDSVLFQPPAHLSDLIRRGRWRRAIRETYGWARLRRTPVLPLLRDATAMARISREAATVKLAEHATARGSENRGHVGWFVLPPVPDWATRAAVAHLSNATAEAANRPDPLHGLDASIRTLTDEIREVARTAAADSELAAACGIDLHNPFLDAAVVDSILRNPLDDRAPIHTYKPLLIRAVGDLLPPAITARTTKGSFDADHFAGMRANLGALLPLADGHLAALGLVDPPALRRNLRRTSAGIPMSLASIEQALTVEAWLHAHHREPAPTWIDAPHLEQA